jgi:dihydroxyacetone kinase-like protein
MDALDLQGAARAVHAVRLLMDEHRDRLVALDQAVGDGDLGLTMTKAFAAADEYAASAAGVTPGKMLMQAGMAIAKAAPSTMGTLVATGFMRGGKAVADAAALDTPALATFFRAFTAGIMERGKTQPGNKTVVDALDPAATALEAAAARRADMRAALTEAATAAENGRAAARQMMSQHGKAAVFREQTIGVDDPGAAVGALILQGFAQSVQT